MRIHLHGVRYSSGPRSDSAAVWISAQDAALTFEQGPLASICLHLRDEATATAVADALNGQNEQHRQILQAIDPRLLAAEPAPDGGLLYRRCHVSRLPLAAPSDGWQWQHEDAEPGDPRHGVCATVAGCLDEIDAMHAEDPTWRAAE